MAGAKDAEWRPFIARPSGRAGPRPAVAGRRAVRRSSAGCHAGRGGRWTAGRIRPPPGLRRRHAMAADRRHACTPGRRPRRNGARWNGAADGRHDFVPPMAGRNGAAYQQHLQAGLRSQAGGNGAAYWRHGMVPPIGGTVYGGTVWCRLLAARYGAAYWRHGIRRHGWGGAGPCVALQRTPGGVLVPGR